ncbi:YeeE/YedE thiosulfate transporter family protein [Desulfofundulus salinus]|nr:YeeE/YedE thiosulfate transporter family protein [Desulfofundulus salinum]
MPKEPSRKQWPWAISVFAGVIVFGLALKSQSSLLAVSWLVGLILGFVLQRSRLCLASAFRDLWLLRDAAQFRGLWYILLVASIGFFALQYSAFLAGKEVPLKVSPAGGYVAIGAFLFGVGMVLASGCASGMLVRLGEGSLSHLVVFICFIIGALGGARTIDWWEAAFPGAVKVFFPKALGWGLALLLQLGLLVFIYLLVHWRKVREVLSRNVHQA